MGAVLVEDEDDEGENAFLQVGAGGVLSGVLDELGGEGGLQHNAEPKVGLVSNAVFGISPRRLNWLSRDEPLSAAHSRRVRVSFFFLFMHPPRPCP